MCLAPYYYYYYYRLLQLVRIEIPNRDTGDYMDGDAQKSDHFAFVADDRRAMYQCHLIVEICQIDVRSDIHTQRQTDKQLLIDRLSLTHFTAVVVVVVVVVERTD